MKSINEIIVEIAEKNSTTPEYVRQKMESAISHAWENGNLKSFFSKKPSIEHFLTSIVKRFKKTKEDL